MKPPPFEYHDPSSLDEALGLLAEHGDDAKVLAGGQSLVPMLNFRLMRPARLIDINRIGGLGYVRREGEQVRIGALARHRTIERSPLIARAVPLMAEAIAYVAHAQVRARGTIVGSAVHADPSAEVPVVLAALDAQMVIRRGERTRVVPWDEFFVGLMETAIEPDELVTELRLPVHRPGRGSAFVEFARRHGDFALGGVAATVEVDADDRCRSAAIALLGAGPVPLRAREAEQVLVGRSWDDDAVAEAARLARAASAPMGDMHAGVEYRQHLLETLTRRALHAARVRAAAADQA